MDMKYTRYKILPKLSSCTKDVFEVLRNIHILAIRDEEFEIFNLLGIQTHFFGNIKI